MDGGDFSERRERMVRDQIAIRGVRDPAVLAAMRQVPREEFVGPELRRRAYDDSPLPIEDDQTISQPYIVALMLDAARIGPDDRVLEIGAGSGYASAAASLHRRARDRDRAPRRPRRERRRAAGPARLRQGRDPSRRRQRRLARGRAVRRHPRRRERAARARGAARPARRGRPAGDAGRRERLEPAPGARHPARRRRVRGRGSRRRGVRAAARRARLAGVADASLTPALSRKREREQVSPSGPSRGGRSRRDR